MKSMILVLKPEECCNLMNGKLTLLIRKMFPKDFTGWVNVYCGKSQGLIYEDTFANGEYQDFRYYCVPKSVEKQSEYKGSGKVVARFWCEKVEEIDLSILEENKNNDICKKSCLSAFEMADYIAYYGGYAIHISNLEIFDKPKEFWRFWYYCSNDMTSNFKKCKKCKYCAINMDGLHQCFNQLKKAPKNYCYVEEHNL